MPESDPTQSSVPPATIAPGDPAISLNAGAGDITPANATVDQLNSLIAENTELKDRVQRQSGILGQQGNALKSLQTTVDNLAAVNGSEGPPPTNSNPELTTDPVLSQRVKDLEKREQQQLSHAKFSQIQSAMLKAGIPEANVQGVSRIFDIEMGERLESTVGDYGTFAIGIREAPETLTSLPDYVGAWLQTESGRTYLPAQINPSTVGVPRGKASPPASMVEYTRAQINEPHVIKAIAENRAKCIDF